MGVMFYPRGYYYCDWNVTVKARFLNATVAVHPAARRGLLVGTSETSDRPLFGYTKGMWNNALSRASGYCAWMTLLSVFSFLLFVAGASLIRWGLGDIAARESALAFGIGLATWGWLLVLVGGVAAWVRVSATTAVRQA